MITVNYYNRYNELCLTSTYYTKTPEMEVVRLAEQVAEYNGYKAEVLDDGEPIRHINWEEEDASGLLPIELKDTLNAISRDYYEAGYRNTEEDRATLMSNEHGEGYTEAEVNYLCYLFDQMDAEEGE